MNTMRFTRASPSFHSVVGSPLNVMCTPWNTNFSFIPWIESTPLLLYMSTPLSLSSVLIHLLSFAKSSMPSFWMPTDVMLLSCVCSCPSSARKPGSMSTTLCKSKARTPRTLSNGTTALSHRITSPVLLILRSLFSTSSRCSGDTRSVLFSSILSANTTCSTHSFSAPSGFTSSKCCITCFASTKVTMASSLALAWIPSSMKNVWATGAGSAIPVVSINTASSLVLRLRILLRMRIKSPLTVQQIQPLFISNISSEVSYCCLTKASSIPTSPNSFSITATLSPWFEVRM
mmetsp:Transcript_52872/g.128110  ORF Transcript_52872/g.128110 Transcript_52872/m.128110 type:complete len:289 (-) Transcript_52872:77-943(-)